jgi:hypothetical protein
MVPAYEASLSETTSVSFHLFGMDPLNVAVDQLAAIRQLAQDAGKPSLQTEMTGDGLGTAILAHHTLVDAGSAAYLQQSFVGNELDEGAAQLIGTDGAAIVKLPPFHALSHFARFTDPGYTRVEAVVDAEGVLASAWIAPDDSALAIVLVNPEMDGVDVEVNVSDAALVGGMQVLRTTFNGVERSAQLGPLPDDGVVRVPPQSIVTLAVPED